MKTVFLTIIATFLLVTKGFGQNLVQNPSFEDTISCPNSTNQINRASGWTSFGASPDYYNSCSPQGNMSVPLNIYGYQFASTGNAFAGIVTWGKGDSETTYKDIREFIGRQLSTPLVIGQEYYVSFKVNLTLNNFETGYATNKLGARFSTVSYNPNDFNQAPVNNIAHVYSNQIISDSVNWTKISGFFIADSAYTYVCIGNFFDNANVDSIAFDTSLYASYYFIDDVCVSLDSTFCNSLNNISENNLNNISIYPNPTNDFLNIDLSILNKDVIEFKIIDIMGKMVFQNEINSLHSTFEIKKLASGLYNVSLDNQRVKQIIINP